MPQHAYPLQGGDDYNSYSSTNTLFTGLKNRLWERGRWPGRYLLHLLPSGEGGGEVREIALLFFIADLGVTFATGGIALSHFHFYRLTILLACGFGQGGRQGGDFEGQSWARGSACLFPTVSVWDARGGGVLGDLFKFHGHQICIHVFEPTGPRLHYFLKRTEFSGGGRLAIVRLSNGSDAEKAGYQQHMQRFSMVRFFRVQVWPENQKTSNEQWLQGLRW